jgi:uncharacterized protein (UPF0335 family)
LKSKLQKLEGLKYEELKNNINDTINNIKDDIYTNIFDGAYNRNILYIPKQKTRKYKNYKV